jgi:molecular chaperone GrpE
MPEPKPRPAAEDAREDGEDAAAPEGEAEAPQSEAERLAAELAEVKDQLLRALAEADNQRKRAAREREEVARYAIANFARDMLSLADDLERALEVAPAAGGNGQGAIAPLIEGIEITRRGLQAALDRHGITRIEPLGEKFDHNQHEAMFEVESADAEPGTVVQVVQPGYRIHDRLLRPARVGIAKPPAAGAQVDTEA